MHNSHFTELYGHASRRFELATGKMSVDLVDDRFDEVGAERKEMMRERTGPELPSSARVHEPRPQTGKESVQGFVTCSPPRHCSSYIQYSRYQTENRRIFSHGDHKKMPL